MGQKAQLWWDLPAIDAFDLLRAIYDIPAPVYKERLNHLTELLDVKRHLGTQIRRLSLGRANEDGTDRRDPSLAERDLSWMSRPSVSDMLPPTSLREFLREFNHREKATIILTSHNMEDIERLCPVC